MSFSDVFKSSFLEQATTFSVTDTLLAMGVAFVLALFIYLVYRKTYSGVMYSNAFGVSLIAMTMITTLIILAITSNVILSLGMVGALSIVRFRSAIKEPMDIAFLFWAISVGIVMGAGLMPLGIIGSVIIGLLLLVFGTHKTRDTPYMLLANCSNAQVEQQVVEAVRTGTKKSLLKAKTVSQSGIELTVEVRLKEEESAFLNQLSAIPGVSQVSLVSYNGEYMA